MVIGSLLVVAATVACSTAAPIFFGLYDGCDECSSEELDIFTDYFCDYMCETVEDYDTETTTGGGATSGETTTGGSTTASEGGGESTTASGGGSESTAASEGGSTESTAST